MRFWLLALLLPAAAHAALVRGVLKVDVRTASGRPLEAKVTLRPDSAGEPRTLERQGDVYVADGLTEGVWIVEVEGAPPQTVHIVERRTAGAVFVLGKRARRFDQPARSCTAQDGAVVEAVGFEHDRLGAGMLTVRKAGKQVCSAIIAGGGASLRLRPGNYVIDALFVGGGKARISYLVRDGRAPQPLVLRAK